MQLFLEALLFFLLVDYVYIKIAARLNLTDHPNQRSSHSAVTITGAGFIFPVAFLAALLFTGEYIHYRALLAGLVLVSGISFLDDLRSLSKASRIIVQIVAVSLLLWQTGGLFNMTIWALIPGFIFVVGIINAYNFMDGINGITGLYSLTAIVTIYYLRLNGFTRLPVAEVFIFLIAALIAFLFFNARKTAKAFCGDIGSISIAFIISFLIIQLMIQDDNGKWILLIGVYGLDSVSTIILRLIRDEDIGKAHRSHFYQYLVNERKLPHVLVALIYAAVQLLLNYVVIAHDDKTIIVFYILLVAVYAALRLKMEGRERLFIHYQPLEKKETSISRTDTLPRWAVFITDLGVCCIALMVAYLIRYNLSLYAVNLHDMQSHFLLLIAVNSALFFYFKTYSGIFRYTGLKDALHIFYSQLLTSTILFFVSLLASASNPLFYFSTVILIIYTVFSFLLLIGYRLVARYLSGYLGSYKLERRYVIIYGAGEAGVATKKVLENETTSKVTVLAFLDDDERKVGKVVNGTKIYSAGALKILCETKPITEVIIAAFALTPDKKNKVVDYCLSSNIRVLHVPPVNQWMNGRFSARQLQPIKIEDLLEREQINIDTNLIGIQVQDKCVLVTGAAGSIGSEIVRQILKFKPRIVILCDQAETPLHQLLLELGTNQNSPAYIPFLGDVRSERRMNKLFSLYEPQIVYHAAAYKHVPMMEFSPAEAVITNLAGTKNIADLSVKHKVEKFVMVSTDKAVNPTNVMGASKRLAEMYIQFLHNSHTSTKFITTRFGNVLGSNGSVVQRFREQIEYGGPLTVTHIGITRYFMTIPEACQLVLQAGAMGKGGEIFLFDMGQPVTIYGLAEKMIRLYGLVPGKDIEIVVTGLRPGEKLYEELWNEQDTLQAAGHEKIHIVRIASQVNGEIISALNELISFAEENGDEALLLHRFYDLVPEFQHTAAPGKGST